MAEASAGFALDAAGALPSDNWTPHRPDRDWVTVDADQAHSMPGAGVCAEDLALTA